MPRDSEQMQDDHKADDQDCGKQDSSDNGSFNEQDVKFVQEALESGFKEVVTSELAVIQAENPENLALGDETQNFAQLLVAEHDQLNRELSEIAFDPFDGEGIPQLRNFTGDAHEALEKIEDLRATEFDVAYLDLQIQNHREAISLYQEQVEEGENQRLVEFAEDTLPILESHLDLALSILELA